MDGSEDLKLIQLIASHQPEALRALYRRHGTLVYSLAFRMLHDTGIAEEITQDVFQRVWEHATRYQPDKASVLTWIIRIARNRALDELRKHKSRQVPLHDTWNEATVVDTTTPGPEENLSLNQERESVRQALSELTEPQRIALELAFFQGLTHRQIAVKLQQPLGTVKTRIRDAIQVLRDRLKFDE